MNPSPGDIRGDMEEDARKNSMRLCPDDDILGDLLQGLSENHERYGYGSCPCRISSGNRTYDGDIVCPCEYRDADVAEFGMCYCALFVSEEVFEDPSRLEPIPERRPPEISEAALEAEMSADDGEVPQEDPVAVAGGRVSSIPVWRCTVCGYLAARDNPPPICPICKAKAEKFEQFAL